MSTKGILQQSTKRNQSPNNEMVGEQEKQQKIFIVPKYDDVLGGRGNGVGHHPGNYNFRKLVKE